MEILANKPSLEIEGKYHVPSFSKVREHLRDVGATGPELLHQRDIYFAHPVRDFARTDEALRVRYSGNDCTVTYKGPKLEGLTLKAREEINLVVDPSGNVEIVLKRLGFSPVLEVMKVREVYHLKEAVISLDEVTGLGTYVEIELTGPEENLDPETELSHLKELIGVEGSHIPLSYLELLLAKKS